MVERRTELWIMCASTDSCACRIMTIFEDGSVLIIRRKERAHGINLEEVIPADSVIALYYNGTTPSEGYIHFKLPERTILETATVEGIGRQLFDSVDPFVEFKSVGTSHSHLRVARKHVEVLPREMQTLTQVQLKAAARANAVPKTVEIERSPPPLPKDRKPSWED